MQAAGGRGLVRKVSMEPKFKSKKRERKPAAVPGLQRYLALRGTPNGVHEFRRSVRIRVQSFNDGIVLGAARGNGWGLSFTTTEVILTNNAGGQVNASLPNAAELSALFDMIKIDKVEVTLQATNQSGPVTLVLSNPTNSGQGIQVQTCIDYNSGTTAPATESSVQEYGSYQQKMLDAGKVHTRMFSPKYSVSVVDSTGTQNSAEAKTGYLRSNNSFIHSGLYGWAIGPTNGTALEFCVTYVLKCKNTK